MNTALIVRFLCGIGLVSLAIGCSGINTVSGHVNTATSSGGMTYTQVGDIFLNDQLQVADILIDQKKSPPLFSVKLKNLVWFSLVVEVKMDYYDENGVKMDNPWGWKPVTVTGAQDEWVQFMAPNAQARHFKLYVQKAG